MKKEFPRLLTADKNGNISDMPGIEAAGSKCGYFFRLKANDLIKLPYGSELFMLPDRHAVGYSNSLGVFLALDKNPLSKKQKPSFAVGAFVSPGFTTTYTAAYTEDKNSKPLPLFSYAAACFYKGAFYAAAMRVDRELRQDLRFMDLSKVKRGVKELRKAFSKNRLIRHLETCALVYGCPAAKNFFLKRYEAPLPTSPSCNSQCMGCISYQPDKVFPVTQPRIKFIPTPEEIAQVALFHIKNVKDPVVSFGQGCEGEPLMVASVLLESVKLIRQKTQKGMINLNTNASKPEAIGKLFGAGLNSIRVSTNSVQEMYYNNYYKPKDYSFCDVIKSIRIAKNKNGFVSINYLIFPGFSDSASEFNTFRRFIRLNGIDMIQLRNLNIDPVLYFKKLKLSNAPEKMLGIKEIIRSLKKEFPRLMLGYFNPSRQRINRN